MSRWKNLRPRAFPASRAVWVAFELTGSDRIPVVYTPSSAGLYVQGQRLLDFFAQYPLAQRLLTKPQNVLE